MLTRAMHCFCFGTSGHERPVLVGMLSPPSLYFDLCTARARNSGRRKRSVLIPDIILMYDRHDHASHGRRSWHNSSSFVVRDLREATGGGYTAAVHATDGIRFCN